MRRRCDDSHRLMLLEMDGSDLELYEIAIFYSGVMEEEKGKGAPSYYKIFFSTATNLDWNNKRISKCVVKYVESGVLQGRIFNPSNSVLFLT